MIDRYAFDDLRPQNQMTDLANPLPPPRGPCVYLGPATGEAQKCPPCEAKAGHAMPRLKTFHCELLGQCTPETPLPGVACCALCDYHATVRPPKAAGQHQFPVTANGIGDHMIALQLACGWKRDNPGAPLALVVRHTQWTDLFDGFESSPLMLLPGAKTIYPETASRGGLHFVQAVARIPVERRALPTMNPLPEQSLKWAEPARGAIVLCPVTLAPGAARDWALPHWLDLERMLNAHGHRCVVIAGGQDAGRVAGFRSPVHLGEPAANVAALMVGASCVASNESGMAHLAGALQAPCVVVSAVMDGPSIHGFWPRSKVIQKPLATIMPEEVFAVVQEIAVDPTPFLADPLAERHFRGMLKALRCERGGVVPSHGDRERSMSLALRPLVGGTPLIVETGCQRQDDDWSAGMSTQVFGYFLKHNGGHLISVDNDAAHVDFARSRIEGLPVEVVLSDSRDWLRDYAGPMIELLYLDSADTYVAGYAECCLQEAQHGAQHVSGAILLDDTMKQGDGWAGKGRLAIPWLLSVGWRVEYQGRHQTLLRRA